MAFEVITVIPPTPTEPWVDQTFIGTVFYVRLLDGTLREVISSAQINNIVFLTQAEYNALPVVDGKTLYINSNISLFGSDVSTIGEGERITGVHAGTFGEQSLTDDYKYICVLTGIAETTEGAADGTAKWKKQPLFQSI